MKQNSKYTAKLPQGFVTCFLASSLWLVGRTTAAAAIRPGKVEDFHENILQNLSVRKTVSLCSWKDTKVPDGRSDLNKRVETLKSERESVACCEQMQFFSLNGA